MQALLTELNSIPNNQFLNDCMIRSNVLQNVKYENKKRRFIKILQSVNPNFTIQFTKDNVLQILVNDKILVKVNIYSNDENLKYPVMGELEQFYSDANVNAYFLKLEFTQSVLGHVYNFDNKLNYSRRTLSFHDSYIYDGEYIEKLLKLYYTKKEFIRNAPSALISIMPNDLINLIYSYTTSSLIFT
jgi:hypothetical protein